MLSNHNYKKILKCVINIQKFRFILAHYYTQGSAENLFRVSANQFFVNEKDIHFSKKQSVSSIIAYDIDD